MKEISIEDKARRYDEALNELQVIMELPTIKSNQSIGFDSIRHIFPELKEPEDEATWLKKYVEEEMSCLSIDIRDNDDRIKLENLKRSLAWLEKQSKALKVEVAMRDIEEKAKVFTEAHKGETSDEILAQMRCVWWSEEDYKMFDKVIEDIEKLAGPYVCYRKDVEFIKSIKDRVQPQLGQDLSEEDKRKINRIYSILGQAADAHAFSTSCRLIGDKECVELQDFLKSLTHIPIEDIC